MTDNYVPDFSNMSNKEKWIWLAAFFDGEGSIRILGIGLPVIKLAQSGIKGKILLQTICKQIINSEHKIGTMSREKLNNYLTTVSIKASYSAHYLQLSGKLAYYIISNMYPYLKHDKKEQAKIAMFCFDCRKKYKCYKYQFRKFIKECQDLVKECKHSDSYTTVNLTELERRYFKDIIINLNKFY